MQMFRVVLVCPGKAHRIERSRSSFRAGCHARPAKRVDYNGPPTDSPFSLKFTSRKLLVPHVSSVFSQMMDFCFVGNSHKVREGTCVIHCVPRSPAKPIREARQHSHRRSHFAKPLRGWSVLCAIMANGECVVCFHGSRMPRVDV